MYLFTAIHVIECLCVYVRNKVVPLHLPYVSIDSDSRNRVDTYTCTAYCIWSVISSFSNLNR